MTEPAPEQAPEPDDYEGVDMAAVRKLRREAQALRRKNHELEEQLGAAAAREGAHQIAVVAAAAKAAGMIDPSDFLAAHPNVDEFLDEQFNDVLPDKVAEATAALLESKPYLGRPVGPPPSARPVEGLKPGARAREDESPAPSWTQALRGH